MADNKSEQHSEQQESQVTPAAAVKDEQPIPEVQTDLTEVVRELEVALAAAKEGEVRALAEQQNAQRRAEQEVQKARKFALERLIDELVPVVDNLERAMQAMEAAETPLKAVFEGIELTYREFMATLKRQGVELVDPQGEPFNPEYHQAISLQEQAGAEPNTVLQVIQKGYLLNGRLLRPAMVVVCKSAG